MCLGLSTDSHFISLLLTSVYLCTSRRPISKTSELEKKSVKTKQTDKWKIGEVSVASLKHAWCHFRSGGGLNLKEKSWSFLCPHLREGHWWCWVRFPSYSLFSNCCFFYFIKGFLVFLFFWGKKKKERKKRGILIAEREQTHDLSSQSSSFLFFFFLFIFCLFFTKRKQNWLFLCAHLKGILVVSSRSCSYSLFPNFFSFSFLWEVPDCLLFFVKKQQKKKKFTRRIEKEGQKQVDHLCAPPWEVHWWWTSGLTHIQSFLEFFLSGFWGVPDF